MIKDTQGVTALMYLTHLIVGHVCKQELQKFATGKHHESPILDAGRGETIKEFVLLRDIILQRWLLKGK